MTEKHYMRVLPMPGKLTDLENIPEEELLSTRICDLPLKVEGSWLEECIKDVYRELDQREIIFKPACYLADEWLTPDGEPVVGIPFYLAHPVLMKIEKKMMLDVEGETKEWCLMLIRHEIGHAINYAYRLYKKKKWQRIFGSFKKEYKDTYRFRPYSRNFVRHLEDYYAQYHPDEDFAETFSVWLNPESDWESQYRGWNALNKLRYVEELMKEIRNRPPAVSKGKKYWEASRMKQTLKNYYKRRKDFHAEDFPDFHDANLKEIFIEKISREQLPAYKVIKKYRADIITSVFNWTGERKYVIDDLLKKLIRRCRELRLVVSRTESHAVLKISVYVTTLIMNYLHTGRMRLKK
ncbi:MAG: hypothetical protein JW928_02685 [Candidatus Aureabacteria bacterium]|nr:hypothetical protein [Candidatus Auribacterota bacterium]